jgi:DNA-binding CsgD family transcriptional regulator
MTVAADPAGREQPDLAVVAQRATHRAGGAGESDGRQRDAAPARQVGDEEVLTAQTQVMLRASTPSVACWILRPVAGHYLAQVARGGDHMADGTSSGSEPLQVRDLRQREVFRRRGDGGAEDEPSPLGEPTYLVLLAQDRPDHSLAMPDLLGLLVATQRTDQAAADLPLDYLTRLLHAVDANPPAAHPGPAVAAAPGPIDALTARELQVLELLATGRSNRRIAAELVVTVDTVKKHVGHVLDKLGAANRTEAAARARQLGLIS